MTVSASILGTVLALSAGVAAIAVLAVAVVAAVVSILVRAGAAEQRRRAGSERGTATMGTADSPDLSPQGPQRYLVTVHSHDGTSSSYSVVTAADSKRAASIAFDNHGRSLGADPSSDAVRDVQVEHLGPAALTAAGRVDFRDGDLFDQSEFPPP